MYYMYGAALIMIIDLNCYIMQLNKSIFKIVITNKYRIDKQIDRSIN